MEIGTGVTYSLDTDTFSVPASVTALARPISVCVHVGRRCNLSCDYCLSDSGPQRPSGTGTLADYMSAIMQWAPLRIVWSGGEPMLHRNIGDFMGITKQHGCVNILTTNGTMAPRPALAPLTDWADISLHGVDTATFQATTSLDLFDAVINNIARYTKVFMRTSASLVLVRRMMPGLYDVAQRLRDAGVRRLRLSRLLSLGRGHLAMHEDLTDVEVRECQDRLLELVPQMSVVIPAIRKRAALTDGYFVIENDGTFSSPPSLADHSVTEPVEGEKWSDALAAHRFLFSGIED